MAKPSCCRTSATLRRSSPKKATPANSSSPAIPRSLADAIARIIDNPQRRRELGAQNYVASRGLPIGDVVDWYLLHFQMLIDQKGQKATGNA